MKEVVMVQDLVCGMEVDETDRWAIMKEFAGQTYYFCSVECKILFARDPMFYINQSVQSGEMTKDIVCGQEMDKRKTFSSLKYRGRWYYFCSESCMREFQRHPEKYIVSQTRLINPNNHDEQSKE